MADFIVLAIVGICLAASIGYTVRRKKKGGSSCGCGCSGCNGSSCCKGRHSANG